MATYTQLSSGSRGDEVKKLQQALVDAGYNVGSAGVDGSYGPDTTAAVKKYQQDKGLQVDGIAGEQTLGSLYSAGQTTTQQASPTTTYTAPAAAPDYSKYQYDSASNDAYMQALAALQAAQKEVPTYAGTYDSQIQDLYNQIVNRPKFKYDLNSDMLYQQYRDQYAMQGQLAMKDTMGQAAALTGGYGNTYAQAAGQQAYDAYLQQLNDVVPELYGMAMDQYNMEGDQMVQQYGMLGDMADTEYGRYQDSLNQYWQNIGLLKDQADDAYNQGYENWYNAHQMGVQQEQIAYEKQLKQYDKLVELITSTGYAPTTDELTAAGMTPAQAQAYKSYYDKQNAPKSSGGGGSSSGGSKDSSSGSDGTNYTAHNEAQKQAAIAAAGNDALGRKVFGGSTYSEAVAYMKANGVPGTSASAIMTNSEWSRRKAVYDKSGVGGPEVEGNASYVAYLRDVVNYKISTK